MKKCVHIILLLIIIFSFTGCIKKNTGSKTLYGACFGGLDSTYCDYESEYDCYDSIFDNEFYPNKKCSEICERLDCDYIND